MQIQVSVAATPSKHLTNNQICFTFTYIKIRNLCGVISICYLVFWEPYLGKGQLFILEMTYSQRSSFKDYWDNGMGSKK